MCFPYQMYIQCDDDDGDAQLRSALNSCCCCCASVVVVAAVVPVGEFVLEREHIIHCVSSSCFTIVGCITTVAFYSSPTVRRFHGNFYISIFLSNGAPFPKKFIANWKINVEKKCGLCVCCHSFSKSSYFLIFYPAQLWSFFFLFGWNNA